MKTFEFDQPNLILCEGSHDRAFFRALLSYLGLTKFQTTSPEEVLGGKGGNTQWGRTLAAIVGTRKFETLGGLIIVVDNDDNPELAVLSAQRAIITSPVFAGPPKLKMRRLQKAMVATKGPPKSGDNTNAGCWSAWRSGKLVHSSRANCRSYHCDRMRRPIHKMQWD